MITSRLKVFPAVLMLALVACEDSITGVPDPVVEAAPVVEAVTSVAMVNGGCVAPGAGLISWWPGDDTFDDIAEPLADANNIAFNSKDAIRTSQLDDGDVTFGAGNVDQAFRFTSELGQPVQFLEVPDAPDLRPAEFTVDLWAQSTGVGQVRSGEDGTFGNVLILKAVEDETTNREFTYAIFWDTQGEIKAMVWFDSGRVELRSGRPDGTGKFPPGQWVHIALTVGGSNSRLYVNGSMVDSDVGGDPVYDLGSTVIGASWKALRNATFAPLQWGFHGLIDEIDIFDRALMADEIQAIHDAGSAGKCDGSNEAPVVAAVTGGPVDEGSAFATSVSFTDDSGPWTATVDYGDGTVEYPVVSGMSVPLSHTYAQDGEYTVTVTVNDGELYGSSSGPLAVNNVAPTVAAGSEATILEGSVFDRTGSFTDPGVDDVWTATVDYGDGDGPQVLELSEMSFGLSHTYAQDGEYTVTVTVTDDAGAEGSASAKVVVNNVLPSVNVGPDARVLDGGTFKRDGFFTDPGADVWTATVDYGDNPGADPEPLTLLPDKSFVLYHDYAGKGSGPFTVRVVVTDDDESGIAQTLVTVVYPLTIDRATVKLERRRRWRRRGRDTYGVNGRVPLSLLERLDSGDAVTIGFAGSVLEIPAGSLVRKGHRRDQKWRYKARCGAVPV